MLLIADTDKKGKQAPIQTCKCTRLIPVVAPMIENVVCSIADNRNLYTCVDCGKILDISEVNHRKEFTHAERN